MSLLYNQNTDRNMANPFGSMGGLGSIQDEMNLILGRLFGELRLPQTYSYGQIDVGVFGQKSKVEDTQGLRAELQRETDRWLRK